MERRHRDEDDGSKDAADIRKWRDDTPGCRHRNHLNNAGAALMPRPVLEAITAHLDREAAYGGYEAADAARDKISAAYEAVARLVGAGTSGIALVENATVAMAQSFSAFDFKRGDSVVTTNSDYSSYQIMLLSMAERLGIEIHRAADLPEGGVDPDSIRTLVEKYRPRLVLTAWVPTNSGLVQDVHAVGEVCSETGTPFLLDACQAVGQIPVDVSRLRCDFLAATARKFLRGPRGLGFLYVSERALEEGLRPLHLDTRGATWTDADRFQVESGARRFENWEFPYALVMGIGAAADYAIEVGVEKAGVRAAALAARARERLADLEGVQVLDTGRELCAIVTVGIESMDADRLVGLLREMKINTSAVSRDHAVIDMDAKQSESALRISPHYYNTADEVDDLVDAIEQALS